ncbi:MAG TPA: KTSC domain-containing protein [Kiritimatiellia bacterium]|nr:KTSC domain-containing protein [Kiritimatiellia bacterium]HRZ12030.1 KTSC domain-containing protein [Kiritimatiellia bacterium]HSA17164.1 KTSC domain-containing protein [Kiritimatiellia bacterium]
MRMLVAGMAMTLALLVGCKTTECCKKSECKKSEKAETTQVDMKKVESSTIDKIGYDAESQTLTVSFDNGDTYNYKKVPEKTYKALMKAKSKGKYFHKNIKDKFESEKAG